MGYVNHPLNVVGILLLVFGTLTFFGKSMLMGGIMIAAGIICLYLLNKIIDRDYGE